MLTKYTEYLPHLFVRIFSVANFISQVKIEIDIPIDTIDILDTLDNDFSIKFIYSNPR